MSGGGVTINIVRSIFSGKKQLALSLISVATKGEVSGADQHGKTPLHFAAEKGLEDVLMALIVDKRVDVHPKTINGWTPLHHAAFRANERVIKLLVDIGEARVDALTNEAFTPLHYAAAVLSPECCEALISRHADVNAINNYNETPLDMCGTLVKREMQCKEAKMDIITLLKKDNGQSGSDVQKRLAETAVEKMTRALKRP